MPVLARSISDKSELHIADGIIAEEMATLFRGLRSDLTRAKKDLPLLTLELQLLRHAFGGASLGVHPIHDFYTGASAMVKWLALLANAGVKAERILAAPFGETVAQQVATTAGLMPLQAGSLWTETFIHTVLMDAYTTTGAGETQDRAIELVNALSSAMYTGGRTANGTATATTPGELWGHWPYPAARNAAVGRILESLASTMVRRLISIVSSQEARQPTNVEVRTGTAALAFYSHNVKMATSSTLDVVMMAVGRVAMTYLAILELPWIQTGLPLMTKEELTRRLAYLKSFVPSTEYHGFGENVIDASFLTQWLAADPAGFTVTRTANVADASTLEAMAFAADLTTVPFPGASIVTGWLDDLGFVVGILRDLTYLRNRMFDVVSDVESHAATGISLAPTVAPSPRMSTVVGVDRDLDGVPMGPFFPGAPLFLKDAPTYRSQVGMGPYVSMTSVQVEQRLESFPRLPIIVTGASDQPPVPGARGLPTLLPTYPAPFRTGTSHPLTINGLAAAFRLSVDELRRTVVALMGDANGYGARTLAQSFRFVGILEAQNGSTTALAHSAATRDLLDQEMPALVLFPFQRRWYHCSQHELLVPPSTEGNQTAIRLTPDTSPIQVFFTPFTALPSTARVERLEEGDSIARLGLHSDRPDLPLFDWTTQGNHPPVVTSDIEIVGCYVDEAMPVVDIVTIPSQKRSSPVRTLIPLSAALRPWVRGFNEILIPDADPDGVASLVLTDPSPMGIF